MFRNTHVRGWISNYFTVEIVPKQPFHNTKMELEDQWSLTIVLSNTDLEILGHDPTICKEIPEILAKRFPEHILANDAQNAKTTQSPFMFGCQLLKLRCQCLLE